MVFDLAIADRSGLLERARRDGATAIGPDEMWIHQGAAQLTWLLGEPVTTHELAAALALTRSLS
jgi:shikimate 5-dehydrogenase